jgi:uncharacterized protein DUF4440
MRKFLFTFIALNLLSAANAEASSSLTQQILSLDKKMFDAFNTCDIKTMYALFDQDLEFYHDKGGLTNYSQNLKATTNNCNDKIGLTRTLLPEYNAIYPAGDYGAIQEGRHQFCHVANGKNDCGTFKFVHIWKNTNGQWTISRVISYGH